MHGIIVVSFAIVISMRYVYRAHNIINLIPVFTFCLMPVFPLLCYNCSLLRKSSIKLFQ